MDAASVGAATAHQFQVLWHVLLAMVLGGLIGIERELAGKPAGLRTQMLVAGAAALLVGIGHDLVGLYDQEISRGSVRSDPVRIVEAIITGVSFLGAGTIFRRSAADHVQGLTTAACILLSASIGICVALEQIVLGIGVTFLVLVTLRGLGFVEDLIATHHQRRKTVAKIPDDV